MNRIIMALLMLLYLMMPSYLAFAQTAEDAGIAPETAKEAMFVPGDPGDTGAEAVTATDAGLASEETGEAASSEAGVQAMDSSMDVGMDY